MKHVGFAAVVAIVVLATGLITWKHWPRAQVTASLGSPPNVSPMGAYKDATEAPSATAATAATPQPTPTPPATKAIRSPYPNDEQFKALASGTLREQSRAYDMAYDCMKESQGAGRPDRPCGMTDGLWQDRQTRKKLVTAKVETTAFGAVMFLREEGPNGRFAAFADDPAEHARLMARATEAGLANAEPVVLGGESVALIAKGDALRQQGDAAGATTTYRQAMVYAAAAAANMAKVQRYAFDPATDPQLSVEIATFSSRLAPADLDAAIQDGLVLSKKWSAS